MSSKSVSVTVTGTGQVVRNLEAYGKKGEAALEAALYQEALEVMADSKREVPVDTGTLRSTGHVEKPSKKMGSVSVTMKYGGPAAKYALKVHETHATKSKYLERPFLQSLRGLPARLAARMKRALR